MKNILKKFLDYLPDSLYLRVLYFHIFRKPLNLKYPKTFNEKLQWLKLYDRNPIYTKMVDKYEVRKYIKNIIGDEYLIPLIGVWDDVNDIDFDLLPNQFVLKCTHDSGSVYICNDKKNFDIDKVKQDINKHLKKNFYYVGREWPYKNVKPRIICEEYMIDSKTEELRDYKVFNFNGKSKYVQVDCNRFTKHTKNIYNTKWEFQDFEFNYKNDKTIIIEKPKLLDEMIKISELLSKNITFLRTDFYIVNNKLYIGELTFFPASGFGKFYPDSIDYELGTYLNLNESK